MKKASAVLFLMALLPLSAVATEASSKCQAKLEAQYASKIENGRSEVQFITDSTIYLERRLVDTYLVQTCQNELDMNQYDEPKTRLACNLITAERPKGLSWYGVSLQVFNSSHETISQELVAVNSQCEVQYTKTVLLTENEAD